MTQMTVQTEPGATPEASQGAAAPRAPRRHVGALDGLRAIAVAAVVAYHLDPTWLPGGYLGVDVFFVLSGYLITSGLVRDHDDRDGIRLGRFWLRRLRRLVPALWTMTLVITAALSLMPSDLRAGLGRQLLGAFTWTSNWLSIMADDSYFAEGTPIVFVHLWSLAIEEQFYLVWPLLLFVVLRLPRAGRAVTAVALALASAGAMGLLYVPGADPSAVYFGTFTHVFGLMLGAALAFLAPLYGRGLPRWSRLGPVGVNVVAIGALALVGVGFALLGDQLTVTYRGGMLLVAVMTTVGIATLGDRRSLITRLLSTRPLRWIGRLSYGIYLWHWPVTAIVATRLGGVDEPWAMPLEAALVVVISLGAAAASSRWIERPIMRLGFLGAARAFSRRLLTRRFPMRATQLAVGGMVSVLCLVSVLSAPEYSTAESYVAAGSAYTVAAGTTTPGLTVGALPSGAPAPQPLLPDDTEISRVRGADMLAAGDSVMQASAARLAQSHPGILIDAQVARQSTATFAAARQLLAEHPERRVLVLHAGTNGAMDTPALEDLIAYAGPSRRVVIVDVFAERRWEQADNEAIAAVAAEHPDTVAVAQWHAAIQDHIDELAQDRIHPGDAAAARYVQAVDEALAGLGVTVVG